MLSASGKLLSINVTAIVHEGEWTGSKGRTGIDKRPVSGPVSLANEGVQGDVIIDRKVHGGYHAAVYAYAREDSDWWEKEIGQEIGNGKFGENITTSGMDVTHAVIGERWEIGSTILEVSQPRIPCRVFAGFWERPTLIKDFTNAARPGTYLRIIQEGRITAGDVISLISRPSHGITIQDIFNAKSGERSKISEIAKVQQLSDEYKEWAMKISSTPL